MQLILKSAHFYQINDSHKLFLVDLTANLVRKMSNRQLTVWLIWTDFLFKNSGLNWSALSKWRWWSKPMTHQQELHRSHYVTSIATSFICSRKSHFSSNIWWNDALLSIHSSHLALNGTISAVLAQKNNNKKFNGHSKEI